MAHLTLHFSIYWKRHRGKINTAIMNWERLEQINNSDPLTTNNAIYPDSLTLNVPGLFVGINNSILPLNSYSFCSLVSNKYSVAKFKCLNTKEIDCNTQKFNRVKNLLIA